MKKILSVCILTLSFGLYGCTNSTTQTEPMTPKDSTTITNIENTDTQITEITEKKTQDEWEIKEDNHVWKENTDSSTQEIIDTLTEYSQWWEFDETWVDILYQVIDTLKE